MSDQMDQSLIHCNQCQYEGKVEASGAKHFLIFFIILLLSAFFLPFIVVALGYMIWVISQSPKRFCPQCKSTDIVTAATKVNET